MVEKLLVAKADVKLADSRGNTALVLASRNRSTRIRELLLSRLTETCVCAQEGPAGACGISQSDEAGSEAYLPISQKEEACSHISLKDEASSRPLMSLTSLLIENDSIIPNVAN